MDRSQYPALVAGDIIHLDASAAFPVHNDVIAAVTTAMTSTLGTAGKACYEGARTAGDQISAIRQTVADFIHADPSEIFFVASATDAARIIGEMWAKGSRLLYSAEDHSRVLREVAGRSKEVYTVSYANNGEYDYSSIPTRPLDVALLSHIHHVYGSDNHIHAIRKLLPGTKLVVDASQSISRTPIDVTALGCDALFFSAQKIGGLAGVGILYLAKKHHDESLTPYIEPNTLPLIPLVSLQAAVQVICQEDLAKISAQLSAMTVSLISELQQLPSVTFAKGPAFPDYRCHGHGIVSFSVTGYSSHDVAMILADQGIQVRGGDHCVDPTKANQDVVRISLHRYTTVDDMHTLVAAIAEL